MAVSLVLDPNLEVVIPSGLGADGGTDAMGFSAMGVCGCVLLDMGGLGDTATTGLFITPAQISSSMLAQSLLSMTRTRCLWSSWTVLQNMSRGAPACMAHHWRIMASVEVYSFCTSQKSWVSQGSLGPKYSFLFRSTRLGGASQAPCIT